MKKRKIVVLAFVFAMALFTAVYAFGEKIVQTVNEQKTETLLDNITGDYSTRAELSENEIITRIKSDCDIEKTLKSRGLYKDDINIALKKYIDASIYYGMTTAENEYIISLAKSGLDFEKIIDIYSFIQKTDKDISALKDIYDLAEGDFDSRFWIESAYSEYVNENALKPEDIYYYTDYGISIDEILSCYELSLQGKEEVGAMLDSRLDGMCWYDIAANTYDLPEIDNEEFKSSITLPEICSAADAAKRTNSNISDVIDLSDGFAINTQALQLLTQKQNSIISVCRELGITEPNDPSIIDEAAEALPDIDLTAVEKLINEGYRIREIKAVSEGKKSDETIESILSTEGDVW